MGRPGCSGGERPNLNDFARITGANLPEGAVVATPSTLYMGFGLEGITDADTRAAVMGRAVEFLLR
jgi:hypothetical protein